MIANFQNTSSGKFNFNGVDYHKNFIAVPVGQNNIRIVNAYDTKFVLLQPTSYTDFKIDGADYSTRDNVISALGDVIFAKFTIDGVAQEFQDSINNQLTNMNLALEEDINTIENDVANFKSSTNATVNNFQTSVNNDLQQITAEKQVFESEAQEIKDAVANMTTTGKIYDSLADAIAESPKPADGTPFSVMGDGDNDGYWKFDSNEEDGVKWGRKFDRRMQVESISLLRNYKGRPGEAVDVLGYYESGDGGGGTFYWDAVSTGTDNGGTVIEATTGGLGRWKRESVNDVAVEWFGSKGDGITDDSESIQRALLYSCKNGLVLKLKPKKYIINNPLYLGGAFVQIDGNGAELISGISTTSQRIISQNVGDFAGFSSRIIKSDLTITSPLQAGESIINTQDLTGVSKGDYVVLTSGKTDPNYTTYKRGFISKIKSVNTTFLEIYNQVKEDFSDLNDNVSFRVIRLDTILIRGLKFSLKNGTSQSGLYLPYCENSIIENCTFKGNETAPTATASRYGVLIGGNENTVKNVQADDFLNTSLGYGIGIYGNDSRCSNNILRNCKHGIAAGSNNYTSYGILYDKNKTFDCVESQLDFHGSVEDSEMMGNILKDVGKSYNNACAFKVRGVTQKYINNTAYASKTLFGFADGVTFSEVPYRGTVFSGCTFYNFSNAFRNDLSPITIEDLEITNTIINNNGAGTYALYLSEINNVKIHSLTTDSQIRIRHDVKNLTISGSFFRSPVGVRLSEGGQSNITIKDNNMVFDLIGVYLDTNSGVRSSNLKISNNEFLSRTETASNCIRVKANYDNLIITGNSLDSEVKGIRIDESDANFILLKNNIDYFSDSGNRGPVSTELSGATENRPTENIFEGSKYYDTTLGKPIWYSGTDWVDATGTIV